MSASQPLPPTAPKINYPNNNDDDPFFSTLESIMRVTLAGFGGALAGVSFARRGGATGGGAAVRQAASALANKTGSNATKAQSGAGAINSKAGGSKRLKRQRPIIRTTPPSTKPYVDRELPTAWAMACMAFAGVIECTRMMSPTTMIWEVTKGNLQIDPSMSLISDHIIGGAIAGALFKGSAVRTRAGARFDASIMGGSPASNLSAIKGKPLSGILPGAALGLLAGVAIVAVEHAQIAVEDKLGHLDDNGLDDDVVVVIEDREEDPIPADIKAMSSQELAKEIENLKKGIRKDDSTDDKTDDTDEIEESLSAESSEGIKDDDADTADKKQVRDLISAIGFRPYPTQ